MANLHHLQVSYAVVNDYSYHPILAHIQAPVATLLLHSTGGGPTWDETWCQKLHFASTVRTLDLDSGYPVALPAVYGLLMQMPQLENLTCHLLRGDQHTSQCSIAYVCKLKSVEIAGVVRLQAQVLVEFLEHHGLSRSATDGKLELSLRIVDPGIVFRTSTAHIGEEDSWLAGNVRTVQWTSTRSYTQGWSH
ncbi:hypothetical protein CALCODRAFT_489945 [Calocera cornea HHB12733]|uniref:Uncharacterized protein n=1 Tax=Calocera cornea HHB12733 TaxID=1353952 RepID=A0A165K1U6_9BASI|nr:hypothetical protein CALCODRAFT_489945 [Calocera cornea HHB12733]